VGTGSPHTFKAGLPALYSKKKLKINLQNSTGSIENSNRSLKIVTLIKQSPEMNVDLPLFPGYAPELYDARCFLSNYSYYKVST